MKHLKNLLAVALLAVMAVPAFAGTRIITLGGRPGVANNGRAKFVKFATTDSTRVAIGVWGGAISEATASDTTAWIDIGGINFTSQGYSGAPRLQFQINHQIGAATDSIGYKIQYLADENDKTTFSTSALTHVAANVGGSTFIDALAPTAAGAVGGVASQAAQGARQIRLILLNNKIASGVTRLYSVVPVARVE